jgi:hypothetical protein
MIPKYPTFARRGSFFLWWSRSETSATRSVQRGDVVAPAMRAGVCHQTQRHKKAQQQSKAPNKKPNKIHTKILQRKGRYSTLTSGMGTHLYRQPKAARSSLPCLRPWSLDWSATLPRSRHLQAKRPNKTRKFSDELLTRTSNFNVRCSLPLRAPISTKHCVLGKLSILGVEGG